MFPSTTTTGTRHATPAATTGIDAIPPVAMIAFGRNRRMIGMACATLAAAVATAIPRGSVRARGARAP